MSTYHELVTAANHALKDYNIGDNTAKYFMYELLNERGIDMYLHYEEEADGEVADVYEKGIERLKQDEPLAYILGYQWFYGRKFYVHEDVFIPRYETEELCGEILANVDEYFPEGEVTVADIACGSGAIDVTLALEEERLKVYATDLSEIAVEAAANNARKNGADVTFFVGDLLEPIRKNGLKLDILVCNPPYIVDDIALDPSVVNYEPHMALFGGADGLDFYRRLLAEAKDVIKEKAMIAFEIGYDQKEALLQLAKQYFPNDRAEVVKDLNGKDRMFFLYHNL